MRATAPTHAPPEVRKLSHCMGLSSSAFESMALKRVMAMSLSLLKFVGQASLVDDAMLPS